MSPLDKVLIHRHHSIVAETQGCGFHRIGGKVSRVLEGLKARNGVLNLFLAHTSASLCIQENADPDVLLDLTGALARLAPERHHYRHNSEGLDDMPAHIKTLLTATSLQLPVRRGALALGTWQEVYLIEHRNAPHARRLELDFIGYGQP